MAGCNPSHKALGNLGSINSIGHHQLHTMGERKVSHKRSEQLPCRSVEVKFFSVFSAKDVVKFCVKFSVLRFPGFWVCDGKFHVKNGVENGKFHANFTLPGRSTDKRVFALLTPESRCSRMAQMLQKSSVRAPSLSTDEREHPFVWYSGAG